MKIIIIPIVLIGLVGAGYFFIQSKKEREQEDKTEQKRETVDETSDWKTYRNEKYYYLIKYPAYWPVDSANPDSVILGNPPYEPGPGYFAIRTEEIGKNKYYNSETNSIDYAKLSTEMKENFPEGCDDIKKVIIGNQPKTLEAQKIICIEPFAGQEEESYFIEQGGFLYSLGWINGTEEFNLTLNKMLSTFSFNVK